MSKFNKLFEAVEQDPQEEVQLPAPELTINSKQRGRPRGKRSNPEYEQVTAYIRKQTHQQVKIALLQENQGREFSELLEELLQTWLQSRG